ncbi:MULTISPECIES: HAD family phosphatase [unclassified Streptomyces]|uniref:HAD family phosphatase n=1 Tax=unclassified Streptomyces TaxID=2593676 RepID=UPI0033BF0E2C
MGFRQLALIAVNIDGVLLSDTFAPVIRRFVAARGGVYTAELEREVFSQSQLRAGAVLAGAGESPEEVVAAYFREREEYLREHPVAVDGGAGELLERLRATGARVVCYGGLGRTHFERHLGAYSHCFDGPGYVCTDAFRPGVREVAEDVFGLSCEQVLFIDDVARVAEAARALGAAFIGRPAPRGHNFQRALMERAGVRHLVASLDEVDAALLRTVDAEAAAGALWPAPAPPGPAAAGGRVAAGV